MSGRKPTPAVGRFQQKYYVDGETGCWEWTDVKSHNGYGRFSIQSKMIQAPHFSYLIHKGNLGGFRVLHRCDNRGCVNPEHLFLGTHQDNMDDMVSKGRSIRGVKHHKVKLKESEVILIKQFFQRHPVSHKGGQCDFLARWFGVTPRSISYINTGVTWRHV